jgi:hypothetical protein
MAHLLAWLAVVPPALRAVVAGLLLGLCLRDLPAADARRELAALPDFDFMAEARALRAQERYSEALLVLDAATDLGPSALAGSARHLKAEIELERDDLVRRLRAAGQGALTGTGDSVEALTGAVVADLLVIGDVRDLVIQGHRALRGEETDAVIVALSGAGLALTLAPALDLGAAILKLARRAGALGDAFARRLLRLARGALDDGAVAPLTRTLDDAASLARSARPAAALSILRHLDDPADLARAARHAQRPGGAFSLWLGGREAVGVLKHGTRAEAALLVRAAGKGRAGIALIARKGALLLRPHPLLGLLKGFYKGNVPALLAAALLRWGEALAGLFAGWLVFELLLSAVRLGRALRLARPARPAAA